ncbi:MAG: DapH/DapD/GlmU-related protein [Patescibacteria group bacterium]
MKKYQVYKNVKIGKDTKIEDGVIIGLPPTDKINGELSTIIGENTYIRANTIIYAGVTIGKNFQTGPNVLIRENNTIGNNVVVWHGSTLNPDNVIGDNCRIHAGCFLEMVTLGKSVFLGPRVTFTNDPHPMLPVNFKECLKGATVGDSAVIGGNVTILPHIKIGGKAVIGAGSVVVKNISSSKVAVGNPAKVIKSVSELKCIKSGKIHYPYRNKKI